MNAPLVVEPPATTSPWIVIPHDAKAESQTARDASSVWWRWARELAFLALCSVACALTLLVGFAASVAFVAICMLTLVGLPEPGLALAAAGGSVVAACWACGQCYEALRDSAAAIRGIS